MDLKAEQKKIEKACSILETIEHAKNRMVFYDQFIKMWTALGLLDGLKHAKKARQQTAMAIVKLENSYKTLIK
jgi:hypothetical protein